MEKQIFELFMRLRFPTCSKESYYYKEWKSRFEGNPLGKMDLESMEVFKDVLNILYLNTIKIYMNWKNK